MSGKQTSAHGESNSDTSARLTQEAEAKRVAARRRFLLGGAAALPLIVTLGQKQAWAASVQVCSSLGLGYGEGFNEEDAKNAQTGTLAGSIFCRPETL